MMETIWAFLIFWGVWILIPIVVDGTETLYHLVVVLLCRRKRDLSDLTDDPLPTVTVIIPAHNEAKIIDRCLYSLKVQDYPHDKMEVIVVDDGSTDGTQELVKNHVNGNGNNGTNGNGKNGPNSNGNGNGNGVRINGKFIPVGDFSGVVKLVSKGHEGKANALNTGITHAHGDILINIDSDVVLAPHAVRRMAEAFVKDPTLGAATGNIEPNSEIIDERDKYGHLVLDKEGNPVPKVLGAAERFLAASQFLEYINAFRLGREAQACTNTIYTLSGAFSAFRRDVILKSSLYRCCTVSEDTDLTLDVHRQGVRIGYVAEAKAYLEPVTDWDKLYAQRVRWNRGQMEVCGAHQDMCGNSAFGRLGIFGIPKMLAIDHTMAFPRLIWTLLLPFFIFFGYSPNIIFMAIVAMYMFYVFLDFLNTTAVYSIVDRDTRAQINLFFPYCFLLPIYRFIVFHFRMSGYLIVLRETPTWTVPGPVNGFRNGMNGAAKAAGSAAGFLSFVFRSVAVVFVIKAFYSGSDWLGEQLSSAGALATQVPRLATMVVSPDGMAGLAGAAGRWFATTFALFIGYTVLISDFLKKCPMYALTAGANLTIISLGYLILLAELARNVPRYVLAVCVNIFVVLVGAIVLLLDAPTIERLEGKFAFLLDRAVQLSGIFSVLAGKT